MSGVSRRAWFKAGNLLPGLVLLGGFVLTWLTWSNASQEAAKELQDYFDFRAREAHTLTEQRLLAQKQVLRGAQGLFAAAGEITRKEFHDYVESLHLEENYPGIQGVGFSLAVPPQRKDLHIAAVRKESGRVEYSIRPEGKRDLYTSIIYLEPFSGRNLRAFGYDMYSEPVRRAAMERARDSGRACISGKVTLVQETEKDVQAGFLMYLPVFRNGAPQATVQERRASLIGWVYSPFRMDDLALGMYGERAADLDIEIFDGERASFDALMYDSDDDHGEEGEYTLTSVQQLDVADHTWTLVIHSLPGMEARINRDKPALIAYAGIAASLLLAALTWLLASGRNRAIAYAREMNRELILSEQALHDSEAKLQAILSAAEVGIAWANQDGRIEYANPKFTSMFGYTLDEVPTVEQWYLRAYPDADYRALAVGEWNARIARSRADGSAIEPMELDVACKDGSLRHVILMGSWAGTMLLANFSDITERKQMENALRESETRYRSLIENAPMCIHEINLEGRLISMNRAGLRMLGLSDENQVRGLLYLDAVCDADRGRIGELLARAYAGETSHFEFKSSGARGQIFKSCFVPVKDGSKGTVIKLMGITEDITQRKAAEDALQDSERRYHLLFDNNPMPMWVFEDGSLRFLMVNERAVEHYGYTREEFSRMTLRDIRPAEDIPELERAVSSSPDGRISGEWRHKKKDGSIIHVAISTVPMRYGEAVARIALIQDITERKQAEKELWEKKQLLEGIVENIPNMIFLKRASDLRFELFNRAGEILVGRSRDELLGRNDYDFFPKEQADAFTSMDRATLEQDRIVDIAEERIETPGGTRILHTKKLTLRDEQGHPRHLLGISEDITQRKAAEEKLIESEASLRAILDNVPYLIWLKDTDSRFVAVNQAFFRTTGCKSMDEVLGKTDSDLWPRELAEKYRADDVEVMATRRQKLAEEMSMDNGRVEWVETFKAPIMDKEGRLIGTTGFARDITQLKNAEQQLRKAMRYNRSLIEASLDPLVTISEDGKITDVNNATVEATGVTREQLIGSDFSDYFTEPEKAREGYRHVFLQGFVSDYPLSIRHRDGHTTDVLYSASVYRNEAGEVAGVFAAARDITQLKNAEQQLHKAMLYNRSLIEASLDPLVTINKDGKITDVNKATVEVTGRAREQLIGSDFSDYFTEPEKAREGYRHVFSHGFVSDYPLSIRHSDGHTTDVLYSASVYRNEDGEVAGVFAAARDMTRLKQTAARVEHLAHFDALTDLPNRTLFNDRLQQALAMARRDRERCALMFLDLDNFKPVNDTFGHAVGDLLLQEAARRMHGCVRESDTVARVGGDEFIVLLPVIEAEEDALLVAEKIRHTLHQPFIVAGHTLHISSSIGIAVYPEHGGSEAELSDNADKAMYFAKENGRNNVRLYHPGML